MGLSSEVFQQLQKLSTTALYILLREEPRLRSMSVQKLAKYCGVTPKTMRWYLEELASFGLIKRISDHSGSQIFILHNNRDSCIETINEFVKRVHHGLIWDPFWCSKESPQAITTRDLWEKYLLHYFYYNKLSVRNCPVENLKNIKNNDIKMIWHLRSSSGLVQIQKGFMAAPEDFLILHMKQDKRLVVVRVT